MKYMLFNLPEWLTRLQRIVSTSHLTIRPIPAGSDALGNVPACRTPTGTIGAELDTDLLS